MRKSVYWFEIIEVTVQEIFYKSYIFVAETSDKGRIEFESVRKEG